jgi:hypothetical protein
MTMNIPQQIEIHWAEELINRGKVLSKVPHLAQTLDSEGYTSYVAVSLVAYKATQYDTGMATMFRALMENWDYSQIQDALNEDLHKEGRPRINDTIPREGSAEE